MKVLARMRTPEGRVVKFGFDAVAPAGAAGYGSRATPPPMDLFITAPPRANDEESDRGLTWLLRALRERYERYF
jgi:hypothetical protein